MLLVNLAANGRQICYFPKYKIENHLGQRYYSGTGCKKNRNEISSLAKRAHGRSDTIYIEARGRTCIGPISPKKRKDNR